MFKGKWVKEACCLCLAFSIFVAGCGGHAPIPVDRYTPGDEKKSCEALCAEIKTIDTEIVAKDKKRKERDFWNTLEFVGGVFIIVPFFFMDCKGSYEAEIAALQARQEQLKIYFADKNCNAADLSAPASQEKAPAADTE